MINRLEKANSLMIRLAPHSFLYLQVYQASLMPMAGQGDWEIPNKVGLQQLQNFSGLLWGSDASSKLVCNPDHSLHQLRIVLCQDAF